MQKLEKGDNSGKYLQKFYQYFIQVIYTLDTYYLYVKNHDPTSSSSPGILLTRSYMG